MFIKPMVENGMYRQIYTDEDGRAKFVTCFAPAISLIAKVDPARASKLQRWLEQASHYYFLRQPLQ